MSEACPLHTHRQLQGDGSAAQFQSPSSHQSYSQHPLASPPTYAPSQPRTAGLSTPGLAPGGDVHACGGLSIGGAIGPARGGRVAELGGVTAGVTGPPAVGGGGVGGARVGRVGELGGVTGPRGGCAVPWASTAPASSGSTSQAAASARAAPPILATSPRAHDGPGWCRLRAPAICITPSATPPPPPTSAENASNLRDHVCVGMISSRLVSGSSGS